ncbi:MAG: hypothetical protein JW895_17215 [Thermoleophilaceae bacterium]|nr:hypothetical protein [Thermoleophilaceae bacterium]
MNRPTRTRRPTLLLAGAVLAAGVLAGGQAAEPAMASPAGVAAHARQLGVSSSPLRSALEPFGRARAAQQGPARAAARGASPSRLRTAAAPIVPRAPPA